MMFALKNSNPIYSDRLHFLLSKTSNILLSQFVKMKNPVIMKDMFCPSIV